VRTTRFWNDLHQLCSKLKGWNPNNLKSFGSTNAKRPKQDHQNRLMSPIPEGGEPQLFFLITLFRNCQFQ